MIEIAITPTMLQEAKDRFDFGELNGSITKGKGNLAGAMRHDIASIHDLMGLFSLIVVKDKPMLIITYDMMADFALHRLETGNAKERCKAILYWRVSVTTSTYTDYEEAMYIIALCNTRQRCDYYWSCA
jgi:hypothetical protein